jgi:thiamine biosynthesis lipoprotein
MITRRRFLSIVAGSFGGAHLKLSLASAQRAVSVWKGTALGALASMTLVHPDRARAQALIAECVREIDRLESIFSLYRPASAISRLNATGELRDPPHELLELLAFALSLSRDTAGAFDPTVQPLYRLYAHHFSQPRAAPEGPSTREIEAVRRAVDFRLVDVDASRLAFRRRGMGLTLNGVAQGYITDRIADRLREAGYDDVLVDIGETRALGLDRQGAPWSAGIADPRQPEAIVARLTLGEGPGRHAALATSGGYGMRFGPDPWVHHLFDPHTGRSANRWLSVSVTAPRATLADGLSTSLAIVPPRSARALVRLHAPARAYFVDAGGSVSVLESPAA